MEFSSLDEQRRKAAMDQAEARAAAAANVAEASRSASAQRSNLPESATTTTTDPLLEHTQPTQDGTLPDPAIAEEPQRFDPPPRPPPLEEEEPLLPHNLLKATEILQSAASASTSIFAPAPVLRLNAIQISGAAGAALRPGFLASLCRPYMDPSLSSQGSSSSLLNTLVYGSRTSHVQPGQPTTLPSILSLTSSLAGDLDKLDVFSNIEATLAPSLVPGSGEEDVDILLNCGKPRGRVFLKSSTDVGNGEGSASVQGRIRNVFGGAETLQGSASFGTRTKQAFNVEFGAPMPGNVDNEIKVSGFSLDRDWTSFASCSESVQGLRAALSTNRSSQSDDADVGGARTQYELAYEASVRQLGRLMPDASIAMRKVAVSPNVKSALSFTASRDTRDDAVLPSRGRFTKSVLEYAGLGGDAQHVKLDVEAQTGRVVYPAASVFGPVHATLGLRAGMLHSLAPSGRTHFSDRFQLGGPTTIRMFRLNALGPKAKTDSLGGTAYYALGASLLTPIPGKQHWPVQLHSFLNIGQLSQNAVHELKQPSSSIGFGLVYLQGPLRVEFNAGLPLTARNGDVPRKGLQFGIGINFL